MSGPNYNVGNLHIATVDWFHAHVLSDSEYTEPDNVKGNYEWPVTLPPKLLRDGFQIQPSQVIIMISCQLSDLPRPSLCPSLTFIISNNLLLRPISQHQSPPPSTQPSHTSPPGRWGRRPSLRRTSWWAATWWPAALGWSPLHLSQRGN